MSAVIHRLGCCAAVTAIAVHSLVRLQQRAEYEVQKLLATLVALVVATLLLLLLSSMVQLWRSSTASTANYLGVDMQVEYGA